MKMCQNHWETLRKTVNKHGGHDFVSSSNSQAMKIMQEEFSGTQKTKKNFDPLLAAYWSICGNVMGLLNRIGHNSLELLMEHPENPSLECPICYANHLSAEHDRTCTNPDCSKEKGLTFEWMIEKASEDAMNVLKTLPDE